MPEMTLTSVDLPAPLSPTKREDLTGVDVELYIVERLYGPEALRHSPQGEEALRLILLRPVVAHPRPFVATGLGGTGRTRRPVLRVSPFRG